MSVHPISSPAALTAGVACGEREATIRRIAHREHKGFRRIASLVVAVVLLLAAACSSTGPAKVVIPPETPAGTQLRWLTAAMGQLPMSDTEVHEHFDAGYPTMVNPAALNQWLQALNQGLQAGDGPKLVSIKVSEPSMIVATVSGGGAGPRARVGLSVVGRGLIGDLDIGPVITGPVPATWAGVDDVLRSVAPKVRMLVANVSNGSCQPVHGIDPDTPAPFGSVLKLYVLAALGHAVAAGKVRWDQPLTVTAQLKSLPSEVRPGQQGCESVHGRLAAGEEQTPADASGRQPAATLTDQKVLTATVTGTTGGLGVPARTFHRPSSLLGPVSER